MVTRQLSSLSAVRKQHLLVEFSSLKHACPYGVYMSLTPNDPTLWSGVLFTRKGPYAPSILRFQISFPPTYPLLPPLITFSTDIFHPLITPLTTYMYTTDVPEGGTVSATDEERLPPGGFSLRHGFGGWFGRERRRGGGNRGEQTPGPAGGSLVTSPESEISSAGTTRTSGGGEEITTYEVLRYLRSTFDDASVLDGVPLEAAGNPGAWHAWRTHRIKSGHITISLPTPSLLDPKDKTWHDGLSSSSDGGDGAATPDGYQRLAGGVGAAGNRRPGEWNWEGVWEVRVKRGVDASVAEAMLFGKEEGGEVMRFLNLDKGEVEGVMGRLRGSLEGRG